MIPFNYIFIYINLDENVFLAYFFELLSAFENLICLSTVNMMFGYSLQKVRIRTKIRKIRRIRVSIKWQFISRECCKHVVYTYFSTIRDSNKVARKLQLLNILNKRIDYLIMKPSIDENAEILEKFKIKPCRVLLENNSFSKMNIRCTAKSSEKNVELICSLKQEHMNTFSLRIKRKLCENNENHIQQPKRVKLNEVNTIHNLGNFVFFFSLNFLGFL